MQRIRYFSLVTAVLALGVATSAFAQTPNPNSIVYHLNVFPPCPSAVVTTGGAYPSSFFINETGLACIGFADEDVWSLSEDGSTDALFGNNANFSFCADLLEETTNSGTAGGGEAGLGIRPWYSLDDGFFNCRNTDGEIACFGGRLPFYSFTAAQGLHYAAGNTIHLEMTYISGPSGPSAAHPGTIKYDLIYLGTPYTSGTINFDEGNVSEGPLHGLWGILNAAKAGGHMKAFYDPGNFDSSMRATWNNVCYSNLQVVPTKATSWGTLKALYR
jgi:hypothetical protein